MPAPYLVGLDIGTHSIKAITLKRSGSEASLVSVGSIPTPPKTLISEAPEDLEMLAEALKKLRKEAKITENRVVASLPESQIFTRVIQLPKITESEIGSALKWEAEQYIPIPLSEVKMDWQIISQETTEKETKADILLVAAPLVLIEKYLKLLKLAGFTPMSLETEIIAIVRSLINPEDTGPTTMIVSLGASTSDLVIVKNGLLSFTRSIATGGESLARSLAQSLGFEMDQAEEYKKTYGLDETQLEGKITDAIKPVIDVIVNELRRAIAYYMGKRPDDPVKRVILTGGTAKLPGLVVYLAENLGLEVQMGNPWARVKMPNNLREKLENESSTYTVACGLALKQV